LLLPPPLPPVGSELTAPWPLTEASADVDTSGACSLATVLLPVGSGGIRLAADDPDPLAADDPDPLAADDPDPLAADDPDPLAADDPDPLAADDPDPLAADDSDPLAADDPDPLAADDPDPLAADDSDPLAAADDPDPLAAADVPDPFCFDISELACPPPSGPGIRRTAAAPPEAFLSACSDHRQW
jgi:hypothetical protein